MINSRQAIQEYSDAQEAITFNDDRGHESYMCLLEDMRNVISALNTVIEHQTNSSIQFGTIAPENEITSNNSQLYFNTLTSTMYTNPNKGAVTGWVAL